MVAKAEDFNAHTIKIKTGVALQEFTGKKSLLVTMCSLYYPVNMPHLSCGKFIDDGTCKVTGVACLAFAEHTAFEEWLKKNPPKPTS